MNEIAKQLLARVESIDTATVDNRMRSETYERMAGELADAEGRASSPDGTVTVVAGADGVMRSISFTEQIRTVTPQALAASVLHTSSQARALAAHEQAEVVRRGLGDTELLDRVLESDERIFGDQRPQAPTAEAMRDVRPKMTQSTNRQTAHQGVDDECTDDEYFENFNAFDDGWAR